MTSPTPEEKLKLLPCPFCGGDVTAQETRDGPVRPVFVICGECGASSDIYNTGDEAITAWNRRSPSRREVRSPVAGYDQLKQSHYCVDCNKRWFGDDVPCDRTCPFKTRIRALAEEE